MGMKNLGEGRGEQAPSPLRRKILVNGGRIILYGLAVDQLGPAFTASDATGIRDTTPEVEPPTKRLALIAPGINNKEGDHLARALAPSLHGPDTTVASFMYPDYGLSPERGADDILASGSTKVVAVGHSLGAGFWFKTLDVLDRWGVLGKDILVPELIMLSGGYSKVDVRDKRAERTRHFPSPGLLFARRAGINIHPWLWGAQRDEAVEFDGAKDGLVKRIGQKVGRLLYIGDGFTVDGVRYSGDPVIDVLHASDDYKRDLGYKLTIALQAGIGHADPVGHPEVNTIITDWRAGKIS